MNEEYNRSILIGSSENVVERDERSQRHLSIGYTTIKGRSRALVKTPAEQYCMAKKPMQIKPMKIKSTRYS